MNANAILSMHARLHAYAHRRGLRGGATTAKLNALPGEVVQPCAGSGGRVAIVQNNYPIITFTSPSDKSFAAVCCLRRRPSLFVRLEVIIAVVRNPARPPVPHIVLPCFVRMSNSTLIAGSVYSRRPLTVKHPHTCTRARTHKFKGTIDLLSALVLYSALSVLMKEGEHQRELRRRANAFFFFLLMWGQQRRRSSAQTWSAAFVIEWYVNPSVQFNFSISDRIYTPTV